MQDPAESDAPKPVVAPPSKMSDTRRSSPPWSRGKIPLNTPLDWVLAVGGFLLFLVLFPTILGFAVMLAVAFAIGFAANKLLPTKVPYGHIGSTGIGLVGAWLGVKLLGKWGLVVAGLHIFPGILGALTLIGLLQFKFSVDRAKQLEVMKVAADPNDPFLAKELDGLILTKVVGSGANSRVYLGIPSDTLDKSQAVACKLLNEEATKGADSLARYSREIRIAHKLDHAGIVKVHSWGEQGNLLFITMEYINGGTLADVIKPGGLPLAQARDIMGQLAAALQHAHDQGVVHRDIKPANILMANGKCKISDFGLGRAIHDDVSLTKEGTVLGTPAYIAPEQIQGKKPAASCDQYALGVLFYELLTGRRPFISKDAVALLMMQLQDTPTPPIELRDDLPKILNAMVLKMLAKDPAHRFADLNGVLETLREYDRCQEASTLS